MRLGKKLPTVSCCFLRWARLKSAETGKRLPRGGLPTNLKVLVDLSCFYLRCRYPGVCTGQR